MSNVIRIKRRSGTGATGAPSSLKNAELAYNEADDTLYYGKGSDGSGDATSIPAIAGSGAYVTKSTTQTISGDKTFSGTVALGSSATASTQSANDNSTKVATTAYVDSAVSGASVSSEQVQDIVGAQIVTNGSHTGISASYDDAGDGAIDLSLTNTGVTAGSYGSSSSIPTFTVDAKGRLTAAGSASISTSFTLTADSGSNQTISGGNTFTIAGGTGIDTVASDTDTLTINIDSTVATLTGSQTLTNKTLTSPSVSGLYLSDSNIVFEGATADAYETTLTVTDPTADRTITLPDASGTVALKGTIALSTDTTGDYVSSLVAGTGVSLSNNSGEGATPTIAIGQAVGMTDNVTFNIVTADLTGNVTGNVSGSAGTVDSLTGHTTDDLNEGTTNLYFTTARVDTEIDSYVTGGTGVTVSSGEISIGQAVGMTDNVIFNNVTVGGDLTVNGTVTTINSTTITVDDKNLELGSTASPSDASADGGGITLKGTSDKTFNWIDATDAWTSSEHIDLATGKSYYINGSSVLSATTLGSGVTSSSLTSVGTIATGVWQGTAVGVSYGGTGATSAADARTNLGLVIGTNVQAYSSTLAAVAGGTYSGASSITTLGIISTGTWQGTAVGVSYGGTGATSASSARTNLGLAIGSDVQAYSATLAAVAGGSYTGATSITTVGTISTGTWSATIDNTTVDGGTF